MDTFLPLFYLAVPPPRQYFPIEKVRATAGTTPSTTTPGTDFQSIWRAECFAIIGTHFLCQITVPVTVHSAAFSFVPTPRTTRRPRPPRRTDYPVQSQESTVNVHQFKVLLRKRFGEERLSCLGGDSIALFCARKMD